MQHDAANAHQLETTMKVGFIGLGNVGGKLTGSLVRNGFDTVVHDLDRSAAQALIDTGAAWADTPQQMAELCDVVITCLPSPKACSDVMEGPDGILHGLSEGKVWMEMSTTDAAEVERIGELVRAKGALPAECPVSGGCHRAATGNISIFVGGDRETFDKVLPLTTTLGRRVLHTGPLGTASTLKVMTNYLATANLLTCCEALVTMKAAGMDLATTYEAMKISSGTSFVHETESQLILNGARDVNFTLDLILKDIGLFQTIAERNNVPLELSPMIIDIMKDGQARYGERANTDDIIGRLEEATGLSILADGFPAELVDDEPEERGYEVVPPQPV
jgi:3-hydroxyisobutyrate dehydrogenase